MNKKKEKKICIDCKKETDSFYPTSTNRGAIFRCDNCHEQSVRNSVRIIPLKEV